MAGTTKKKRGLVCAVCPETENLHTHHKIPRSAGGTDHPDNLTTLCERHHESAHSLDDAYSLSNLTKIGMEKARLRGAVFGNRTNLEEASAKGIQAIKDKADAFARRTRPMIAALRKAGLTFKAIVEQMNDAGVPTANGGIWHQKTARTIMNRPV